MAFNLFVSLDQPPLALPGESQMSVANLSHFRQLVTGLGGDARAIAERHGLSENTLDQNEGFVDCRAVVDMFEFCASHFNKPLFGARLAQMQAPDIYGVVAALCRAAPDVRTAINCLVRHIPAVHSSESVLELVEGRDVAEFRWSERSNMGINEQANYQGLLINLKMLNMVGGPEFQPVYVSLPETMFSRAVPDMERLAGCPVRVSSGRGAIAFSSASLDVPVASRNLQVYQVLGSYLDSLGPAADAGVLEAVKAYIGDNLAGGDATIPACAWALGLSTRTLQTRLKGEGVQFSELVDRQRLDRATHFLRRGDLSIADIADRLGYAERTGFGRAFKRWTGQSPQQFRGRCRH